jgi:hypothetical protein
MEEDHQDFPSSEKSSALKFFNLRIKLIKIPLIHRRAQVQAKALQIFAILKWSSSPLLHRGWIHVAKVFRKDEKSNYSISFDEKLIEVIFKWKIKQPSNLLNFLLVSVWV